MYSALARCVTPRPVVRRQMLKQYLVPSCRFLSSATRQRYDGIDLRTGREVTSSVSRTVVLDPTEALLQGNSSQYLDEMLENWKSQPDSVHPSWQQYFEGASGKVIALSSRHLPKFEPQLLNTSTDRQAAPHTELRTKALSLISSYQKVGHLVANINPLGSSDSTSGLAELELSFHKIEQGDLDEVINIEAGIISREPLAIPLREVIERCQSLYSSTYGIEYMHVPDHTKRAWLEEQIQSRPKSISRAEKKRILRELMFAATFERFLSTKYPHDKRYGLDGAEGVAVTASTILDHAADAFGTQEVVVGSCHRGRMTMLPCVWRKPMSAIFAEFQGATNCAPTAGLAGDVKYHLGQEGKRKTDGGNDVHISLLPNPSHLEVISAVAAGKAFASRSTTKDPSKILSLALHGDAAFAGQGVVYESLGLSKLPSYNVGGTIRVMVNNQIGFTTDRESARSSHYCTDILKYLDIPIFHVNGDDPETLAWASKLAVEWHAKFQCDVVIDVVCYRKYGHNEIDQPSLTQPLMYKKIAELKTPLDQYTEKLIKEGSFTSSEIEEERQHLWDEISRQYSAAQDSFKSGSQNDISEANTSASLVDRSDSKDVVPPMPDVSLSLLMEQLSAIPDDFHVHKTVHRVLEARKSAFTEGTVDWSTAEALAFGSLLQRGYNIRLTGQDVQRGTFSQRHSVLHDQKTGQKWIPLQHLKSNRTKDTQTGNFLAANSPLTEYATLAFEYGHSLIGSNTLTMWEAQFGDFANLAQVVIDNLITSSRSKWELETNLVLSLPHGYDGQAAEHSSARPERFLSLCSEHGTNWPASMEKQLKECNIQIVFPTTPANYFHLLRRQMLSKHKRPLAIFFSKSLLRHPIMKSDISELESSTSTFQPVLIDSPSTIDLLSVTRVVLCSGQLYAALHGHRQTNEISDTAIVRIEQLHPFPFDALKDTIEGYPNVREIIWAQEEPYNGGAWHYARDRFETVLDQCSNGNGQRVKCVSRPVSAVSAVGSKKVSDQELSKILDQCFQTGASKS